MKKTHYFNREFVSQLRQDMIHNRPVNYDGLSKISVRIIRDTRPTMEEINKSFSEAIKKAS